MHLLSFLLISMCRHMTFANSELDNLIFIDGFLESNAGEAASPSDFFDSADSFSAILASKGCATQQDSTNELSLLPRDGDGDDHVDSCNLPLPITPDTLQLFQAPLDSLDRNLPSSSNDGTWENFYPGIPTTAEDLQRERDQDSCHLFLMYGAYVYHLCCAGPALERHTPGIFPEFISVARCKLEPGTLSCNTKYNVCCKEWVSFFLKKKILLFILHT